MNLEELLTHDAFVQTLARRLVKDEHRVLDVAQETWRAALERPPSSDRPLRPWLARVVKNAVVTLFRGENRRKRRENMAAGPEPTASPVEILEREEIRRNLIESVLALEEPFRSAIVFRYYEGLSPKEIARRLNIPSETVKSRLKRGLQRLRGKLDAQHHGSRKKWILALVPAAGIHLAGPSSSAAVGFWTQIAGMIAMSTKAKVGFVAVFIITAGLVSWQIWPSDPPGNSDQGAAASSKTDSSFHDGKSRSEAGASSQLSHTSRPEKEAAREALLPSETFISGKVVDKTTGLPVAAYDFMLGPPYRRKNGDTIHDTVRQEKGRFFFFLKEPGQYNITIRSSRYIEETVFRVEVPEKKGLDDLVIALDPGQTVSGRVLDDHTGLPVPGALVVPVQYDYEDPGTEMLQNGFEEFFVHAVTDSSGRFTLEGLEPYLQKIVALFPGYSQAWSSISPFDRNEIVLRLRSGHSLSGTVFSDQGDPLAGIQIEMKGDSFPLVRIYESGPDGSFRTEPSLPGTIHLHAASPSRKGGEPVDFTSESKIVVLEEKDMEVDFGRLDEYVTWRGNLCHGSGIPPGENRLVIQADRSYPWRYDHHGLNNFHRSLILDEQGGFEVKKIPLGRHEITLYLGDKNSRRKIEWGTITFDRPGLLLKNILLSPSVLSGIVVDGNSGKGIAGAAVRAEEKVPGSRDYSCRTDDRGGFSLAGISPGIYDLTASKSGQAAGQAKGIEIEKGHSVRDIKIILPVQGMVRVVISGFDCPEHRIYRYAFHRAGETSFQRGFTSTGVGKDGTDEIKKPLEVGRWSLFISYPTDKETRFVKRDFEIFAGSTTELPIRGDEMQTSESVFTVTGRLMLSDGSPLPGVMLAFESTVMGMSNRGWFDRAVLETESDDAGQFELAGFKPGLWQVEVVLPEGGTIRLPDLHLPARCSNPFPIDLAVPQGGINGHFQVPDRGDTSDERDLSWTVSLFDAESNGRVGRIDKEGQPMFDLKGIAPGRYRLQANVIGYMLYRSGPFSLEKGQQFDLGIIELDPCGVLLLDVVDEQGNMVKEPKLHFNNQRYDEVSCMRKLPDGRRLCNSLPLGSLNLLVSSSGFKSKGVNIFLEPRRVNEVRVVLHR